MGQIYKVFGDDPYGALLPHYLQFGGGSSGTSLDLVDGRRPRREGLVGKGSNTSCHHFYEDDGLVAST